MSTCPFAVAAAITGLTVARLSVQVVGDISAVTILPESTVDEMGEAIKHPGKGSLIECRSDCRLYKSTYTQGGYVGGCALAG